MTESPRDTVHRALREQLGSYALGQLGDVESGAIGAHLDGCADCRAELAEIAPLAGDLRLVDPTRLAGLPTPPPELGAQILAAVSAEKQLVDRRDHRRRTRRAALVGVAGAAVLGFGVAVGTQLAPPRTVTPVIAKGPYEEIRVIATGVTVSKAGLVPHTWGIEVKVEGAGFVAGGRYRAVVRSRDGHDLPAGEFIGTGAATLKCNLQAAVLRAGAAGFSILDEQGRPVVQSRFRTR